jgi:hypothetical protein
MCDASSIFVAGNSSREVRAEVGERKVNLPTGAFGGRNKALKHPSHSRRVKMLDKNIRGSETTQKLSRMAAGWLVEKAQEAIRERGRFTVAFSGG